jgi:hypothetical protein
MVNMCMCDKNMADPLVGTNRTQNSRQMCLIVRPRVNHREITFAQQIGIGAPIGHRRGVGRYDPANIGAKIFGNADFRDKL